MRKTILKITLGGALAITAAMGVQMASSNKTESNILMQNVEALASGEDDSNTRYNKIKGDCTKTFSVDSDGYVIIRGKKIKVGGVGGSYTAHYTDVQIDCPIGYMYTTCSECTCSGFWDNRC